MAWSGKKSLMEVMRERKVVKPDGARNAKLYIVGEAPGETEEREGRGFVGATGKLLWLVGREVGIDRELCRVSNVVWVRPPDNRLERLIEIGVGTGDFLPLLKEDILSTNPSCVLAVGETALNALTGRTGITKWRGSILPCTLFEGTTSPLWVVPTFHPSWIVRGNHPHRYSLKCDMEKALRVAISSYTPPNEHFITFSRGATFPRMMEVLEDIQENASFLSYDIEGWFPQMDRIAFSYEKNFSISVPLNGTFLPDEEDELYRMVKTLMEGPTFKVAQNMLFDNEVLRRHGIGVRNVFFDLMLGHKCLYQDLPHSLAYISSTETNVPFYKDDKTKVSEPILLEDYNCRDASVTLESMFPILQKINKAGLTQFFFSVEMSKVSSTHRMMVTGALVDEEKRLLLKKEKEEEIRKEEAFLTEKIGFLPNPKSPKQMKEFLYEKLKAPVQYNIDKKTRLKKITTDEDAILAIIDKRPLLRETLLPFLKLRQIGIFVSTFLEAITVEGKWFTSYNIGGTKYGGRFSSSKLLDGTGISSQNIPKEARVCVVPNEGDDLIWEADSKQAEARFVVWRAEEESLFEAFMDGRDVHRITASIIFEKKEGDVTKLERDIAKRIHHATNYWMGPRKMKDILRKEMPEYKIGESDIKRYMELLREARPMTYLWGCRIKGALARGVRIMKNPFGRRRHFQSIFDAEDEMVREAIAFEPQSTVGDLVSLAIDGVQKKLGPRSVIFCVHDSLVGSCKARDIEHIRSVVALHMERTIPGVVYKGVPLSIPCEFKVGPNWGSLEEVK